jgi:hypothetical protein
MFKIFNFGILRYAARSSKWSQVRKNHLKSNDKCAACGTDKDLEVHHIVPVHINADLELDPDNLITLCSRSCHLLIGHLMDFKSWNPHVIHDAKNICIKIKTRPYKDV